MLSPRAIHLYESSVCQNRAYLDFKAKELLHKPIEKTLDSLPDHVWRSFCVVNLVTQKVNLCFWGRWVEGV